MCWVFFFPLYSLVLQNRVSNAVAFPSFSLSSPSSGAGSKAQRVQSSAQPIGPIPQPGTK